MFVRPLTVVLVSLLAWPALAQQVRPNAPGTQNPTEHRVPWRFAQSDETASEHPVTLYWLASSAEDAERSPLRTSKLLLDASTRCVDFEIVLPERAALIAKLGRSAAVIVDRKGEIVRRADSVQEIERMLTAELSTRDDAMFEQMRTASRAAREGNNDAAINAYQSIWDDRCLYPLAGRDAQRALKSLGVIVNEPEAKPVVDPQLMEGRRQKDEGRTPP